MSRKNRRPCRIVTRARKAAWVARMAQWAGDDGDAIVPVECPRMLVSGRHGHRDHLRSIMASAGIPTVAITKTQAHVTPRMFHQITGRYAGPGPDAARMADAGVEFVADLSPGSAQQLSWIAPIGGKADS